MSGSIYLFSIKNETSVFKLGRTEDDVEARREQYNGKIAKETLFKYYTANHIDHETQLKRAFAIIFIQRRDYGTEYYEGDYKFMICIIRQYFDTIEKLAKRNINTRVDIKRKEVSGKLNEQSGEQSREQSREQNKIIFENRCERCNYIFAHKSAYNKHVKANNCKKTKFQCNNCNTYFASKQNLTRHIDNYDCNPTNVKYVNSLNTSTVNYYYNGITNNTTNNFTVTMKDIQDMIDKRNEEDCNGKEEQTN